MAGKQTRGRQSIEMRQIKNEDDKLVRFSKRKSSIYKKASELAILCDAKVGVVIFSPKGRPYSFAHPSIESIANQFLNQNPSQNGGANTLIEFHRLRVNELNQQHKKLVDQVEADRARGELLKIMTEGHSGKGWWEAPTKELNLEELKQMKAQMVELKQNLQSSINKRYQGAPSIQGESSKKRNNRNIGQV
ncbi:hypothetical protein BT93_H0798 [Corymbia citriodora subsp. variegata]|nr:hypothetical protein BT93_H0798 [Corymbia citriodora subsp. variegata]